MKQCVLQILAFLAYWFGVDALFYWLNRKAKRILTFHNVLPADLFKPDLTNGVSNSVEDFKFIIEEVRKRFDYSVDVFDPRTVTITFDDGFLNQYEIAGRILDEMGHIPAIIFTVGDVLDNGNPESVIIVEQLLHWVTYAPNGCYRDFELTDINRLQVWVDFVRPAFVVDADHKGRTVLEDLDRQYPMKRILAGFESEYRRLRLCGMTSFQANELRSRGWKIGWHTKSHYPLSSLEPEAQREEMTSSLQYRDTVFSYPYGETMSVNSTSLKIAKECGYPCAVSNVLHATGMTGPFFLPRMSLPTDRYLLHFRLSGAEHFLRTHQLLWRRK